MLEEEELVDQTSQNMFPVKQEFIDEKESTTNIPESQKIDTGYYSQWQVVSNSISHQCIDLDANLQDDQLQDEEEQDPINKTLLYMKRMYLKMTTIVQLLTLLLIAWQFSWESQSQNFLQQMMSLYQMKR